MENKRRKTMEHQWLGIMAARCEMEGEDGRRLEALDIGYAGECEFDRWVERFGEDGWRVYRDIWIDAGGPTQIDTLIVTGEGVFVFDVKNYSGNYAYVEGCWSVNGRPIIKDVFVQLKRSMEKVRMMLRQMDGVVPAVGAIVFINEHFTFETDDGAGEQFVMRNELKQHLEGMRGRRASISSSVADIGARIEEYMIECPYPASVCDDERLERLKKGIRCAGCGGFQHEVGRYHIRCRRCGYAEAKEKNVLRSICEYGVLRHDKELKVSDVYEFLDGEVSERYLRSIMIKHFKVISRGRNSRYENPRKIADYLFSDMKFRFKERIRVSE